MLDLSITYTKEKDCMIVRKLQQNLIELSNDWSVISVTGSRQSGEYINLERQNTQRLMKQDAEKFSSTIY